MFSHCCGVFQRFFFFLSCKLSQRTFCLEEFVQKPLMENAGAGLLGLIQGREGAPL